MPRLRQTLATFMSEEIDMRKKAFDQYLEKLMAPIDKGEGCSAFRALWMALKANPQTQAQDLPQDFPADGKPQVKSDSPSPRSLPPAPTAQPAPRRTSRACRR